MFGLKENQKSLFDDVALFMNDEINADCIETHEETEKNGGRIEKRVCRKIKDISWLGHHQWPGLRPVFSVRRIITSKGGTADETGYYNKYNEPRRSGEGAAKDFPLSLDD